MNKVFFTGDLHVGHENVLAFDNRPFKTVEEMEIVSKILIEIAKVNK